MLHKNLFIFYFLHTNFNMIIKTFSHQCNNITEKCQRNLVLLSSSMCLPPAPERGSEAHARAHHTHTHTRCLRLATTFPSQFYVHLFFCSLIPVSSPALVLHSLHRHVFCVVIDFSYESSKRALTNGRCASAHKISSHLSHMCYKRLMHLRNAMQPFLFCGTSVAATTTPPAIQCKVKEI